MKIAVDFDGTCVDHCYPLVGEDAPGCVEVLKDLIKSGHKLILNTMRHGQALEEAVRWFENHQIFLSGINQDPGQTEWTQSPKVFAQKYIDDAAVGMKLVKLHGFQRPVVDWEFVRQELINEIDSENVLPPIKLLKKYSDDGFFDAKDYEN